MVSRLRGSLFQLPVLILLLATAALLLQVYSFCSLSSYRFFDVRSWSHTSWRALNGAVIIALIAIRFRRQIGRFCGFVNLRGNKENKDQDIDIEYELRRKRDAEWRERAKKRLPFS